MTRPGRTRRRSWAALAATVLGLCLAAAPLAFGMFSRAPQGGDMLDDFRPYMTTAEIEQFRGYLDEIDAANTEVVDRLRPALIDSGALTESEYATRLASVQRLNDTWPAITADMNDLLDRMDDNLGSFRAVDALPPFDLFPWFFVLPGLAVAAVGASAWWSMRRGRPARGRAWALVAFGLGLVLAPFVFQMFDRAPQGRDMIDDFRPMMTRDRVQAVQGYFVTLGAAEGQLRTQALRHVDDSGGDPAEYAAIARFSADWPTIVVDFNPMVATMSDNVDNFAAVDAMPRFDLFPWFFVLPGLLIAGLGAIAARARAAADPPPTGDPPEPSEGALP